MLTFGCYFFIVRIHSNVVFLVLYVCKLRKALPLIQFSYFSICSRHCQLITQSASFFPGPYIRLQFLGKWSHASEFQPMKYEQEGCKSCPSLSLLPKTEAPLYVSGMETSHDLKIEIQCRRGFCSFCCVESCPQGNVYIRLVRNKVLVY